MLEPVLEHAQNPVGCYGVMERLEEHFLGIGRLASLLEELPGLRLRRLHVVDERLYVNAASWHVGVAMIVPALIAAVLDVEE